MIVHGDADLPTVVFLHGAGANAAMWTGCRSAVYRSIAPDLPGHGTRRDGRFAFDRAVDEVLELIARLGRPPVLVGLSLGGYVAIGAARRSPTTGVVLSGSTAQYIGFGGFTTRLSGRVLRLTGGRLDRKNEGAIRSIAGATIADAIIERGLSTRAAADALVDVPGRDFHGMLGEIEAPVLILNGERDAVNRKEEEAAAARCRQARIETITDAGHACAISRPDRFRSSVEAFVGEMDAAR